MHISLYAMISNRPSFCQDTSTTSSEECNSGEVCRSRNCAGFSGFAGFRSICRGYRLDQINHLAPHFWAFDFCKSPDQLRAIRTRQKIRHLERPARFSKTTTCRSGTHTMNVIKEKLYWYIQYSRHIEQPASTYSVRAFFVFLDLLECQVEMFAKLLLAHTHQHAAHSQSTANVYVYGVWHFCCHR